MIKFTMNGKDFSNEDLNLLICRDSRTGKTEIMFFTDDGEVKTDSLNAEINGKIEIKMPLYE